MTQDSFTAAERIGATLDVLADALVDDRASHYPAASLSGFGRADHPAAAALFGLRIGTDGPGRLTVHGLGTVIEGSTLRGAGAEGGAQTAAQLLARYGGGAVLGVSGAEAAGQFQLPVSPETSAPGLRPSFPGVLAELASGRDTVEPEELATGAGAEVRMVVPPVFHPLAARGSGAARTGQLAETAEELFAGGDAQSRKDWAVLSALLADPSAAAGVVFAGVAALSVAGRPSHASLVVSLASCRTPVAQLATDLADARAEAEVWTVLLPSGPAVVLVEGRTSPVPAALTRDGVRRWAVSSVAQAFLPLPDGASVLTVQLGTVQSADWELYAGAFAEILKSIQVAWDGVLAAEPVAAPAAPAPAPTAVPEPAPYVEPYAAPSIPVQPVAAAPVAAPVPPAPPVAAPPAPPVPAFAPAPPQEQAPKGTPVLVPPADFNPFAPPAPPAAAEQAPKGTSVLVPPADFDPFAPPAPAAAGAAAQQAPKGTSVLVPPADFDPFAPPAPPAAAEQAPKGTSVLVPPADFDPFAPPAPAAAGAAEQAPKGTPVLVPPADFNPFGASSAPAAPVAAPVAPAPQAPVADPFGTVTKEVPKDPFGTVAAPTAGAPSFAPPVAAPPAPTQPPMAGKRTPVMVPPADFNPFAPPAPPAAAEESEPAKGTPVLIPPADFNPFAAAAPAAPAAPPAPPAPEPAKHNPFG
ncbi:hypothetical protein GCM10009760_09690 [Kitasatospora kazusensis]|uniref:Uncharacterized protein n=1 Tax=Kitasatospora kazusensis TaxID=407974 RepID=A0ABN2YXU9_9ACTN